MIWGITEISLVLTTVIMLRHKSVISVIHSLSMFVVDIIYHLL